MPHTRFAVPAISNGSRSGRGRECLSNRPERVCGMEPVGIENRIPILVPRGEPNRDRLLERFISGNFRFGIDRTGVIRVLICGFLSRDHGRIIPLHFLKKTANTGLIIINNLGRQLKLRVSWPFWLVCLDARIDMINHHHEAI